MSWYAHTGPRRIHSSKFQSQLQPGTERSAGSQYRGWQYSFVNHRTTGTTGRLRFGVTIYDPKGNRAAYLRDCASIQQATDAAKRWIDATLDKMLTRLQAGQVGSIPSLPTSDKTTGSAYEK